MLHTDWFSLVGTSAALLQPQVEPSTAPAAPAASAAPPVNVVGVPGATPTGTQNSTTTGQPGSNPNTALPPAPVRQDMSLIWLMGGVMLLVVILPIFTGRGERKRRAAMMSAIGRGDKVLMSGGVIGTISELSDSEVVVRVEEGKIRYAKASVQQVLESSQK